MNWRVLAIGGAAVLLLGAIIVAIWLIFFSNASQVESPELTPTPIEVGGTLPVPSSGPGISPLPSESVLPSTAPTATPSPAPIAFGSVCSDTWASGQDTDLDTLPDSIEAVYGSNPNIADTDGDGYKDGEEVRAGYDPTSGGRLDSDQDGLLDNDECIWSTDPFDPDSDKDGFMDGAEVKNGFNPTKKGDGKGSDRLASVTPQPTPSAGGGFITPVPQIPQTPSGSSVQFALVPLSQFKITSASTPADMKAYLAQIDSLRPVEFSDGQSITNAIQSAATGNVQQLSQVIAKIMQFSSGLKGLSVPNAAQEYHQLYVSVIDFTVKELQVIEKHATGATQQLAVQAVLEMQNILPAHITRLSQLRQTVEGISNQ